MRRPRSKRYKEINAALFEQRAETARAAATAAQYGRDMQRMEARISAITERLCGAAWRTRRARFVGGSRDGQTEWIDTADPQLLRYPIMPNTYGSGRYVGDEVYRLVGQGVEPGEYVYVFTGHKEAA